jgi:4-hydroxy-tetrahydrodipicolinate synthase
MNPDPQGTAFRGVWPALLVPLNADLNIDHASLAAHVRSLLEAGCGGVTLFGTTGEGPSFSVTERCAALDALVGQGIPAARIMVSTSCAALPDTVELTQHAISHGVHGCLMLPPFFFKGVSDAGIVDSYRYVMDQVDKDKLRLYLYHIPQVAGVGLSQQVIRTLHTLYPRNIMGIKDSACNTEHSLALANAFMKDLTVYVGYEPDLPALARLGSTGAISGLANFLPRLVQRLITHPDHPQTAAQRERVLHLLQILSAYSLMPALKGVMTILSNNPAWLRVRPPLVALTPMQFQSLERQIQAFGINAKID